ncbi:MAG: hypothetical protein JO300_06575 [Silvibacterium sp.]|nr:hypothetical protein [Silvibacterium sp.]
MIATVVACVVLPDAPINVTVAAPAAALAAAVRVTLCATPGVSVNANGVAVMPAGKLLKVTLTMLLKPFSGVAIRETDSPGPPAVMVSADGETLRMKPGPEGFVARVYAPWVPQPAIGTRSPAATSAENPWKMRAKTLFMDATGSRAPRSSHAEGITVQFSRALLRRNQSEAFIQICASA